MYTDFNIMKWAINISSLLQPVQAADTSPSRQGFGRGNTKSQQNLREKAANSPISAQPPVPHLPGSASISSAYSATSEDSSYAETPKRFFNPRYAKCSVKGNFLTLAAQPKNVDLGEWLAHQGKGKEE